jgi:two-component system, NtrC family, nitrogen regulation sensor histidine kinase NtrY
MNTFRFRLVIRVLILAATLTVFAFLIPEEKLLFVTVVVALLCIGQVYGLIRFTERTNRELNRFLQAVRYDDTSQTFAGGGSSDSFGELNEAFNQVMRKLQDSRSEMEVHSRYLNTIIQHVGIGLIAYKSDGAVILINNAAKKLLRVSGLGSIKTLATAHPELADALMMLKHNDKRLVRLQSEGETGYLSIFAHMFFLREEPYILVSLQNIQAELEEKEMEAWQNLIKVLTHEIMNSITPISSMTATLLDMLGADENAPGLAGRHLNPEEIKEINEALRTMHQRSLGLMNFVNGYRNMTLIPKPNCKLLLIAEFFKRIEQLMSHKLTDYGISFRWSVEPETLELTADPALMEQVLINLLLNAIYAVSGRDHPQIALSALLGPSGKVMISVEDNGVGIVEEALEKIFIPFFTTKRQGSGIGLSLSRQILRLHNASISAKSAPNEGAAFTILFG